MGEGQWEWGGCVCCGVRAGNGAGLTGRACPCDVNTSAHISQHAQNWTPKKANLSACTYISIKENFVL